ILLGLLLLPEPARRYKNQRRSGRGRPRGRSGGPRRRKRREWVATAARIAAHLPRSGRAKREESPPSTPPSASLCKRSEHLRPASAPPAPWRSSPPRRAAARLLGRRLPKRNPAGWPGGADPRDRRPLGRRAYRERKLA